MPRPPADPNRRLVHSTDLGRLCPDCRLPASDCRCPRSSRRAGAAAVGDGVARVRLEKKGRGGKTVTAIDGLSLDDTDLRELGKALKKSAGSGGTVKDGRIEIQGDHAALALAELEKRGIRAKRAGG